MKMTKAGLVNQTRIETAERNLRAALNKDELSMLVTALIANGGHITLGGVREVLAIAKRLK